MKRAAKPLLLSMAALLALCTLRPPAHASAAPLTNAAAVLALPAEHANLAVPVFIRGVVTAGEADWNGRFFLQDETGGVFVENLSTNRPVPGDLIEMSGVSHPGAYAPIVTRPTWKKLGTAPLPAAKRVQIEQLMAGVEDSQRVEISGVVRSVRVEKSILVFDVVSGGYRLHVYARVSPGVDPASLIGAQVRVRGTAATSYNAQLRRLITVLMFVPLVSDFIIESTEAVNPFEEPVIPLANVAQYRRDYSAGKRIHVKGTVTHQRLGEHLFLQDATGGLQLKNRSTLRLNPGDAIEAVGFPDFEHFLPVLQDSELRRSGDSVTQTEPKAVSVKALQQGYHHAELVTLKARVMDRATRRVHRAAGYDETNTLYTLQSEEILFSAEAPAGPEPSGGAPAGSLVQVTGVCLLQISENGKFESLQMLLSRPSDIVVLARPSWWTAQRLLMGVALLALVLLVAVSWTVMVTKRNTALKVSMREKEQAQVDLQKAHDELEERVRQRSAQLKLQISARKESEVQFKAVLSERTRLAQELHDTLEQTLTGIALQMDTAAKCVEKKPEAVPHHLQLARHLVSQSQLEVRRSVWDLRSRGLEEFDLQNALVATSTQMAEGTNVRVEVRTTGRVRPLPDVVEDNLLRIAQETLTNILKHSGATQAAIQLDYGPRNITLLVEDNGKGFVMDQCPGPREGHFGLLGITERVKRLGGEVSVDSAPGAGTRVHVRIPLEPPAETAAAAPQAEPDLEP